MTFNNVLKSIDLILYFSVICSQTLDKIMAEKCTFGCSAKSNCAKWDPIEECDTLMKSIENETDVRKIAQTADRCLHLMSMNDACEFMVKHQYPITFENIVKFKKIATKSYQIRLEIMKQLILQ